MMPNRITRDGMLESEAVLSLPVDGRWLFVAILLTADDYGLFEATPFKLANRAGIARELVQPLLHAMAGVDLVRLYVAGPTQKAYGFVPKFGQRFRGYRPKHPLPPIAIVGEDEPLLFNKIKELGEKKSDHRPTVDGPRSDHGRLETKTETKTEIPNTARAVENGATAVTPAGAVCLAIRQAGYPNANPGDALLLSLLDQGATEAEFVEAAQAALRQKPPKSWGWILARVKGRRADAAAVQLAPAAATTPKADAWRRDELGIRNMQAQLGAADPRSGESFNDYEARIVRAWRKAGEPPPEARA